MVTLLKCEGAAEVVKCSEVRGGASKVLSVSCTLGMQIGMLVPDLLQEQWVLDIGVGEKGRERERD